MGTRFRRRLTVLAALFLFTALLANRPLEGKAPVSREPLAGHLSGISGWRLLDQIPLDPQVTRTLKVDDHVFATFGNGRDFVSLYIGFYFSREKVGAAHHPLVCFSGQGWEISTLSDQKMKLADGRDLPFVSMIATRGEIEKQYIAYWFQAEDEAAASSFAQKLLLARHRLWGEGEGNAFVRISLPMENRSEMQCRQVVEAFVGSFYPVFLTYVAGESK